MRQGDLHALVLAALGGALVLVGEDAGAGLQEGRHGQGEPRQGLQAEKEAVIRMDYPVVHMVCLIK